MCYGPSNLCYPLLFWGTYQECIGTEWCWRKPSDCCETCMIMSSSSCICWPTQLHPVITLLRIISTCVRRQHQWVSACVLWTLSFVVHLDACPCTASVCQHLVLIIRTRLCIALSPPTCTARSWSPATSRPRNCSTFDRTLLCSVLTSLIRPPTTSCLRHYPVRVKDRAGCRTGRIILAIVFTNMLSSLDQRGLETIFWSWFQSHSSRCRSRFSRSREILVSVSRELVSNYLV